MTTQNKSALLAAESQGALSSAQKRLDRYENLLIGHVSGLKSLEEALAELVSESVKHYRTEVGNLRIVYLQALKEMQDAIGKIVIPGYEVPEIPELPVEESDEEEDEEEEGDSEIPAIL